MEPVRVKVYGLFYVTRRRYLLLLALGLVGLLAVLVVWILVLLPQLAGEGSQVPRAVTPWSWLLRNLPWIVLAAALAEILEAVFVLRRFGREEAGRRAALLESKPPS